MGGAISVVLSNVVFPLLALVLSTLLILAAKKLYNYLGIKNTSELESLLEKGAYSAVALAEEAAAKKLKETEITLPGNEKLTLAMASLMKKVPKISKEQAEEAIESILGKVKGMGASGDSAVKLE